MYTVCTIWLRIIFGITDEFYVETERDVMKKVNTKCREMEIERDDGDVSVCMLNLG